METSVLREVKARAKLHSIRNKYRFIETTTGILSGTQEGINILEADWDNLIILDACRYDVFEAVNKLPGVLQRKISKGAATPEFIANNFANRTAYDTVYISSNAMIGELANSIDVYKLVGLWDEQTRLTGYTPPKEESNPEDAHNSHIHPASLPDPEPVVERTVDIANQHPNKRIIAHFLQPHTPFLVKDGNHLSPDSKYRTYTAAAQGKIPQPEIQAVYEENVEYVLRSVRSLIERLRGKTVVTADHGELLGEGVPKYVELLHPRWEYSKRYRFNYGHYRGVRVPELVTVPWVTIDSDDRREIHDAGHSIGVEMDRSSIEDQLDALGYR